MAEKYKTCKHSAGENEINRSVRQRVFSKQREDA